jgi:hypothetical protein
MRARNVVMTGSSIHPLYLIETKTEREMTINRENKFSNNKERRAMITQLV